MVTLCFSWTNVYIIFCWFVATSRQRRLETFFLGTLSIAAGALLTVGKLSRAAGALLGVGKLYIAAGGLLSLGRMFITSGVRR
jgi:hypothetical protein